MWLLDCVVESRIAESGMTRQEYEIKMVEQADARKGATTQDLEDFFN
jgi:hypothetical protein